MEAKYKRHVQDFLLLSTYLSTRTFLEYTNFLSLQTTFRNTDKIQHGAHKNEISNQS